MKTKLVSWLIAFLSGASLFAFIVVAFTYLLNFNLEYSLLITIGIDVFALIVFGAMMFFNNLPEKDEKNKKNKSIDKSKLL